MKFLALLALLVPILITTKAVADTLPNTDSLRQESPALLTSLQAGYSTSGDSSIYEFKSPNALSCIRKQIAAYNEAANAYPGGAAKFSDNLFEKHIKVRMFFSDFTRDGSAAQSSLDSDNLIPKPNVISESEQKVIYITSSIGVDPKSHRVTCETKTRDDFLNYFSKIKELGFRKSDRPSKTSNSSTAQ